jgi:triacylglycerol lipase
MDGIAALRIPIWGEARIAGERAALRRSSVLHGVGVPRGDGGPVLLIPGFLAGDPTLSTMAAWLRRIGHKPRRAGIVVNVDCAERALRRLERRVDQLAHETGRPVAVVGQSRGGSLARALAVRRPDVVSRVVALGSPLADQLAIHPAVHAQVHAVGLLGSAGVPGFFTRGCTSTGRCCDKARADVTAPFPESVPFTAVYSRTDGIVDWHACLDPAAECIEVRSSHCGMSVHPKVYRIVARALAPDQGVGTPVNLRPL